MHADLDTLATALYVRIEEALKASPQLGQPRRAVGIAPWLTDAELLTLAVMQALLGYHSEARWLRYARTGLAHLFPYLPNQPGYNKRLRAAVPQLLGLPVAFALATPKLDEREVLLDLLEGDPGALVAPGGVVLLADKGSRGKATEQALAERGITLIRPAFSDERPRPGRLLLRLLRQIIESVSQTLKGQLDLEQHGGRTIDGVAARVSQRLLA